MRSVPRMEANELEKAIKEAEKKCAAEFAVVLARRSDEYTGGMAAGVLLAQSLLILVVYLLDILDAGGQWHPMYAPGTLGALLIAVGLGFYVALSVWPGGRLWLVPEKVKAGKVKEAALAIFAENGLFNTSHRRAVLVYVSELERRMDLVADCGLSGVLTEDLIADLEKKGSKALSANFTAATVNIFLNELAEIIARGGFPPDGRQKNEIPDNPGIR